MAVVPSDIVMRLSGGSANANVNASLGGVMSSVPVSFGDTMNNLFDNVSDAEAVAGDDNYRCVYVRNSNGSDTLNAVKIYTSSNTPSPTTKVQIGVDPAGVGDGASTGVATTIADEDTAPSGVTFSDAANSGAALDLGNLGPGQVAAVWIKREVTAGTAAAASDPFTLRVTGTPA